MNSDLSKGDSVMYMQTKIQRWGNSLAIRLTGPARTVPHFSENMPVSIEISEEGITIRPIKKVSKYIPFTEAALLKGMTPALAHADDLANPTTEETDYEKFH
jgi:antitoxin MazE